MRSRIPSSSIDFVESRDVGERLCSFCECDSAQTGCARISPARAERIRVERVSAILARWRPTTRGITLGSRLPVGGRIGRRPTRIPVRTLLTPHPHTHLRRTRHRSTHRPRIRRPDPLRTGRIRGISRTARAPAAEPHIRRRTRPGSLRRSRDRFRRDHRSRPRRSRERRSPERRSPERGSRYHPGRGPGSRFHRSGTRRVDRTLRTLRNRASVRRTRPPNLRRVRSGGSPPWSRWW